MNESSYHLLWLESVGTLSLDSPSVGTYESMQWIAKIGAWPVPPAAEAADDASSPSKRDRAVAAHCHAWYYRGNTWAFIKIRNRPRQRAGFVAGLAMP
jgi:hypothetical protein